MPRPTDAASPADRRTRQGNAILEAVRGGGGFRGAQDVHAQMRAGGHRVGLTTVYRHLQRLAGEGVIDALHGDSGEIVYRHCESHHHHHHLVCRRCGATVEIPCPDIDDWAGATARAAGFSDPSHRVEVFGTCARCR